jgi:hypothetical protein
MWKKLALDILKRDGVVMMLPPLSEQQVNSILEFQENALQAPLLFELALSLYDLAHNYFGEEPYLHNMQISSSYRQKYMGWHRETYDVKQLTFCIYLTPVLNSAAGPFVYQKGTHIISDEQLGRGRDQAPYSILETIVGPAGTFFVADTKGIFAALKNDRPQKIAFGRWGVTPDENASPLDREFLGARYPRNVALQRAVRGVVA